ncbi:MAG: hypothetical protein LBB80_08820 [Treponema sp.]|nr:hypothetical protein [Treponema sp.]
MRSYRWIGVMLGLLVGTYAAAGGSVDDPEVSLDQAIRNAANTIKANFDEGTVVGVLDFNSGNSKLDDYIMQELESALVQGKKLAVTERKNLEQVRQEKLAQLRGDVRDETSAAIGKEQGWSVVILGDLLDMNDTYRFRVRAVRVEEALIAAAYAVDVSPKDRKVRNLLEGKKPPQPPVPPLPPSPPPVAAPKVYSTVLGFSFAWDGEGLGGGVRGLEYTFSPFPYFAFGIEFFEAKVMTDGFIGTFFPIHAGVLVPVSERITAVCYGKMYWWGSTSENWEPLLNTGLRYNVTGEPSGYGRVFITPGIKAGLLFRLNDKFGLELSYTGTWFTQRYVSSIGLGLVGFSGSF